MADWVAREGITHFSMTQPVRQWMDALPDADDGRYRRYGS
jgi:hypothetical protein